MPDTCHSFLDGTTQSTLLHDTQSNIRSSLDIHNTGTLKSNFQNGNILCRKVRDTYYEGVDQVEGKRVECPSTCASGYTRKHCSTKYDDVYVCQKDPQ